ncbi:MAG: FeoA family protein [Clostridia bacterium]
MAGLNKLMRLDELKEGESAYIQTVEGKMRKRLLDMGLIPKTKVKLHKKAPLGDPLEIVVRGYHLSISAAEACKIAVQKL